MKRKKVLLVENDSKGCLTIDRVFIESGYHINKASDGLSAFEKTVRDHYDLVITDLNLPQMNGIDLLKKIKEVNLVPMILS